MLLKRYIPLIIMMGIGAITLLGNFIQNDSIDSFIKQDSNTWFQIIASFAIILGALNLLRVHSEKIIRKQNNYQYSIFTILGFVLMFSAGFIFKGAHYIKIDSINPSEVDGVAKIISGNINTINEIDIRNTLELLSNGSINQITIDERFIFSTVPDDIVSQINEYAGRVSDVDQDALGKHIVVKGTFYSWIYDYMFTPLTSTMFALLAFYVASASYRAFRIRNFEATLLLISGIILMLGRVSIAKYYSGWFLAYFFAILLSIILKQFIKDRAYHLIGSVLLIIAVTIYGFISNWAIDQPSFLYLPDFQDWIMKFPTNAGKRAIMIGVALGIIGTSLRIIFGIDRSFIGERN